MGEQGFYFAHGHGLTNDLIHVPLIIRYGRTLTGRKKDLVQHLDMVPTILNLLHIEGSFTYRGRNLLNEPLQPAVIYSELGSENISAVSNDMKLILYGDNAFLFDIQNDFYETQSLASHMPYRHLFVHLVHEAKKFHQEDMLGLEGNEKMPQLTEEEKEKLRSLGYIEPGD